jgi:hypothetical protein
MQSIESPGQLDQRSRACSLGNRYTRVLLSDQGVGEDRLRHRLTVPLSDAKFRTLLHLARTIQEKDAECEG